MLAHMAKMQREQFEQAETLGLNPVVAPLRVLRVLRGSVFWSRL